MHIKVDGVEVNGPTEVTSIVHTTIADPNFNVPNMSWPTYLIIYTKIEI